MLPSYTQLGMAGLLPLQKLSLGEDKSALVHVDGRNSQGLENRQKILDLALQGKDKKAVAIKAENLMKLNRDESRNLFKENHVVYFRYVNERSKKRGKTNIRRQRQGS